MLPLDASHDLATSSPLSLESSSDARWMTRLHWPLEALLALVALLLLGGCGAGSASLSATVDGLSLTKSSLSFPATYVGSPSASLALTLTNAGPGAASLTGAPVVSLNGASNFSELDNCSATLAAQASCNVWVVFTPTAEGDVSAELSVANNLGAPMSASLTGTGVANPPAKYSTALNTTTVFMGASITQYWPMPLNNKGIAGQVTSQMLARFQTDVLGHGYARVVILGGSNDILDSLPNAPVEMVANIQAMGQMASNAGMEVVLSQLPPSWQVPANGVPFNTTVVQVNAAIKQLATQNGWLVVDYYTPLLAHPADFPDNLHPNAAGYAVMEAALAGVVSR
jgi:lysophospholipase L1-like esterase